MTQPIDRAPSMTFALPTMTLSTPGMLFPAISLLMLAYTNRFLGLASLARNLTSSWRANKDASIRHQVNNLKARLDLLRHAQVCGVISLFMCTASILAILLNNNDVAIGLFGLALALMMLSLGFSLTEIHLSQRAIRIELDDILKN